MISLFDTFRVGTSLSSSHTAGPMKAGKQLVDDLAGKGLLDSVTRAAVDVYDLLSLTGKGHHADIAIIMGLAGSRPATVDIDSIPGFIRDVEERERLLLAQGRHEMDFPRNSGMRFRNGNLSLHENGMQIHAYNGDEIVYSETYHSIGGGFIVDGEHFGQSIANEVSMPYPFRSATELLAYCNETGFSLSGPAVQNELALHNEKEINEHFAHVQQIMQAHIDRGIDTEGVLSGPPHVSHRASALHRMLVSSDKLSSDPMNIIDWMNMSALAVNKEDAASGHMVAASTNSTRGIVPAVPAYYDYFIESVSPDTYTHYFMAAGAISALHKINVSISGVEVGCQGRVGVACSMVVVDLAELLGGSLGQVCAAAETGVEHNLGLTCNPVAGQARIPCIKRSTIASVKAINAVRMTLRRTSVPCVSLNKVTETMCETGKDMNTKHHETSHGSLAIKVRCDQYFLLTYLQRMGEFTPAFSPAVIFPTTLPPLRQASIAIHLQGGPYAESTTDH